MRVTIVFLMFVMAVGCADSRNSGPVETPVAKQPAGAVSAQVDGAEDLSGTVPSPVLPPPRLSAGVFAKQCEEVLGERLREDADTVLISDHDEKELILDNLAHLPELKRIEFSVRVGEEDYARVAPFSNITEVEFYDYGFIDPALFSSLESVSTLEFSKCPKVDWMVLSQLDGPKVQHLGIDRSVIGAADLEALSRMSSLESISLGALALEDRDLQCLGQSTTLKSLAVRDCPNLDGSFVTHFQQLESLELRDLAGLSDGDLRILGQLPNLKSLAVYNCRDVKGDFLADLKGQANLRDFEFTGPLAPDRALLLAAFPGLQTIRLNSKELLPLEWYTAIADGCRELKNLRLVDQVLDKAKIDRLSSLDELVQLEVFSDNALTPDMTFGGPKVSREAGMLESLARLQRLETLYLCRGYHLNAADGRAIGSLAKLRKLGLWHALVEPGALADVGQLENLTELSLYGCRGLDTADAEGIGRLKKLVELDISQVAKARNADFSHLGGLVSLRELYIDKCKGMNDADMAMAQGMKNLEKLNIEGASSVTDEGIAQWGLASKLRTLSLGKVNIDGTGFQQWPADHAINWLFIEGTSISNDGLKAISRFQNLRALDIRLIDLSGKTIGLDVSCFAATPSLESVAILGSFATTQEALDAVIKARPDMGVQCRVE